MKNVHTWTVGHESCFSLQVGPPVLSRRFRFSLQPTVADTLWPVPNDDEDDDHAEDDDGDNDNDEENNDNDDDGMWSNLMKMPT